MRVVVLTDLRAREAWVPLVAGVELVPELQDDPRGLLAGEAPDVLDLGAALRGVERVDVDAPQRSLGDAAEVALREVYAVPVPDESCG